MAHDCCDSGKMLSVDEALTRLLRDASPPDVTEMVPTTESLGRILATPLVSALDVPPADNSSMDGYAFALADLPSQGDRMLPVRQRICAGDPLCTLEPGSAARIFTGALVPIGADTVIPQEHVELRENAVCINSPVKRGANIRRRGEDITEGSQILAQGTRIRPQEMGMAATMGIARLPLVPHLRVAVFSTGDELVSLGTPLKSGQIYDSNRYMLSGMLKALGCEVIDLGRVADNMAATCEILERASALADVIVTSGGVSVGEEDHVKAAVERLGSIDLWRIAIKPGKPLAFGRVGKAAFFGLPGNPVASFVTCSLFVRPYLLRRQGVVDVAPLIVRAEAQFEWTKPGTRREFLRAKLATGVNGRPVVTIYPNQGSGVLSSVCWGNGFAVIPENTTVAEGDIVEFLPFADVLG